MKKKRKIGRQAKRQVDTLAWRADRF